MRSKLTRNVLLAAVLLFIAASTSAAEPATSKEGRDAVPVSDDIVLQTHNMSAERRSELLELAGITAGASSPAGSTRPISSTDDKGVSTRIWETNYARLVEEVNEKPKPGDTWLSTVTTEALGQSFTVTTERDPSGQVRVTDSRGGWRLEGYDSKGALTRVIDAHGEIYAAKYGKYHPEWVRIGGSLRLVVDYSPDHAWIRTRLLPSPDDPPLLTWTPELASREDSSPRAMLGFPFTVAEWNELRPSGHVHVRSTRGTYAYSPLDGGDLWRVVLLGGNSRIEYTDDQIRVVVGRESYTWNRGDSVR